MRTPRTALLLLLFLAGACGTTRTPPSRGTPSSESAPPVTYEVHEWGLVRGTLADRVTLSGPHVEAPPMPVAKPVLYFHRRGEGALVVDVEARIPNGRIVEHWPYVGDDRGTSVRWEDVLIQGDTCRGSAYPSLGDVPCRGLFDGCEASSLADVETRDASCLFWPRPPDEDGPTQAWNHLFYRGEISSPPPFPLVGEVSADGRLRLTARGVERVPGHVLRIRHGSGRPDATGAITVVEPPLPGESVVVDVPSAPLSTGGAALEASLRTTGLTPDEIAAFRRAWDETLFGASPSGGLTAPSNHPVAVAAMPMAPPSTSAIVYVLPPGAADALATLTFSPAPTAVRRAIVVWMDERAAR